MTEPGDGRTRLPADSRQCSNPTQEEIALSIAEIEQFWATGEDARAGASTLLPQPAAALPAAAGLLDPLPDPARPDPSDLPDCLRMQLKRPGDDCCTGVDKPEIGHVHAPDCPQPRPGLRAGLAYVAGDVPEPLRTAVSDATGFAEDLSHFTGKEELFIGETVGPETASPAVEAKIAGDDRDAVAGLRYSDLLGAKKQLDRVYMRGEFGEPWVVDGDDVKDAAGYEVADMALTDLDAEDEGRYARRIVACVNACAGFETGDLEKHGPLAMAVCGLNRISEDDFQPDALPGFLELLDQTRRRLARQQVTQASWLRSVCPACGSSVSGLDKGPLDIVHATDCWAGKILAAAKGGAQ